MVLLWLNLFCLGLNWKIIRLVFLTLMANLFGLKPSWMILKPKIELFILLLQVNMFMTKYGLISWPTWPDIDQYYKSLKDHGLLDLISMQNGLFSSQSFSRVDTPAWDLRAKRASFARPWAYFIASLRLSLFAFTLVPDHFLSARSFLTYPKMRARMRWGALIVVFANNVVSFHIHVYMTELFENLSLNLV